MKTKRWISKHPRLNIVRRILLAHTNELRDSLAMDSHPETYSAFALFVLRI